MWKRVRLKYNQYHDYDKILLYSKILKRSNTKLRFYDIDMCIEPELTKAENR